MTKMDKQFRNVVDEEKSFNEEERSITHVITVEVSDRYGDIVRADGMDKSSYTLNPVVLYGHDSRAFPVGKSLWQKKTTLPNGKKAIIAKTQFAKTEEGNTVFELWKEGFLNAASIGFMPKLYEPMIEENRFIGYDIKEWELLEYSIVPVPANQEALRLELEKMGDNMVVKSLRDEMEKVKVDENAKREMEEVKLALISMADALKKAELNIAILQDNMLQVTNETLSTKIKIAEIAAERSRAETKVLVDSLIRRAISDKNKIKS